MTMVAPEYLDEARSALRRAVPRGMRRLHFYDLKRPERMAALRVIEELPVTVIAFTHARRSGVGAHVLRDRCIAAVLECCVEHRVQRLVIESSGPHGDGRDRRAIARCLRLGPQHGGFEYRHEFAVNEPLLWVSDAVAWAMGRREAHYR